MISEDITFNLFEVKCDGCGDVKIFYKEDDYETLLQVQNELMAMGWVLEMGGGCYCKRCVDE